MADIKEKLKSCLIIVSSHEKGIKYESLESVIKLTEHSPLGGIIQFIQDEEEKNKEYIEKKSTPFDLVDPHKYSALFIPSMYCSFVDLSNNERLGYILNEMHRERKLICGIGYGVSALLSARTACNNPLSNEKYEWTFEGCTLTAPTLFEEMNENSQDLSHSNFYLELQLRSLGAQYTSAKNGFLHIVVDENIITAQNQESSAIALNAAIFMNK
ncbi:hypothetical protein HZS_4734 [Henneguya salminicola]|nr:hypothetical protein HZS_4734 [Henneguya salminicola]